MTFVLYYATRGAGDFALNCRRVPLVGGRFRDVWNGVVLLNLELEQAQWLALNLPERYKLVEEP